MKYGRSLSFCVKDILSGKVKESDVALIVSSTACPPNISDWDKLIEQYHESYWYNYSLSECKNLVKFLFRNNKIYQPRLHGLGYQALYNHDIWADTKEEVFQSLTQE